jgi:ribokinase
MSDERRASYNACMASIVVVGSINLDIVTRVETAPRGGETLRGQSVDYVPGGKGANQAVAAARLGAAVRMVARVGDDPFGPAMRENLSVNGVDVSAVAATSGTPTGVAVITVEASGQNRIIIVAGANGALTPDDVDAAGDAFAGASYVLLQNEVSPAVTVRAAQRARAAGAKVVWNPAPAPDAVPPGLIGTVDILVPNESEAERLSGEPVRDETSALEAARELRASGFRTVVITLGSAGALWSGADGVFRVPAFPVNVVDTTAAGDTFVAGLAVGLSEGMPPRDAMRFASASAALAVTRLGAQAGIPTRAEVEALLNR